MRAARAKAGAEFLPRLQHYSFGSPLLPEGPDRVAKGCVGTVPPARAPRLERGKWEVWKIEHQRGGDLGDHLV